MKAKVYIETSIPSFYCEIRKEPDMVARRQWTRDWWAGASSRYTLVSSSATIEELEGGDYPTKKECLELIEGLPILPVKPAIAEIVKVYMKHHLMPKDPVGDALHLAIASYYKCEFLLTWNCQNLANANKFGHIKRINALLDLFVPTLVTPLQLRGVEDEPE